MCEYLVIVIEGSFSLINATEVNTYSFVHLIAFAIYHCGLCASIW